ncbi:hypothetical protein V1506DRAFT_547275 [Lipomyces tetrasporus]
MAAVQNVSVIYHSMPNGIPTSENLPIVTNTIVATPPTSGVVLEVLFVSLDPFLRGKMRSAETKSYSVAFTSGQPVTGFGIARVFASDTLILSKGDIVRSSSIHFSKYQVVDGAGIAQLEKLDNKDNFPLTRYLGILGMPGLTAFYGLYHVGGNLRKGETILVSAATGAVGQVVGQLAKREGLRVVGTAGSDDKVMYLKEELHFDDAWNYRNESAADAIGKYIPEGIDIYFDNVGGELLDAAIENANNFARIIACGSISQAGLPPDKRYKYNNVSLIVGKRIKLQGFIVLDVPQNSPEVVEEFRHKISEFLRKGEIMFKEDIVNGIENTADAFAGIFNGKSFGKTLVQFSD